MKCPYCYSVEVVKCGIRARKGGAVWQNWRCKICGREFIADIDTGDYVGKNKIWSDAETEILLQFETTAKNVYTLYNELRNTGYKRSYTQVGDKIKQLGLNKPKRYATGHEFNAGYLDIETTGLVANIDIMLSWCIKVRDKNKIYGDLIIRDELFNREYDKRICNSLCETLKQFDLIFTYYGTGFDVKFMRTRCIDNSLEFPLYRQVSHKDVYYSARSALKLHKGNLGVLCQFLGIDGKTHFDPRLWRDARYGDEETLDKIYKHNRSDVIILEKAHKKLEGYIPPTVKPM